jgi:DNA-binding MarR family transcriptional regulator
MNTTGGGQDTAKTAVRLAVAVKRLRSRMREESGATSTGLSASQLSIFGRIMNEGADTAAALAAAEHVSQQAIAQNLAVLKADGFVTMKPDPTDRRKSLISMTPAGRLLVESIYASRDDWLIRAIESAVGLDERTDLDKAIELLERLAGVELNPRQGIR